jgi:hypothetical protein
MKTNQTNVNETGFDLFRLTKSKEVVDVCPNTLRAFFKQGLASYRNGKCVFVSKSELNSFIRRGAVVGSRIKGAR